MIIKDKKRYQAGFTLVEICLVLILSGLLLVAFFSVYKTYRTYQANKKTIENMQIVQEALREYFGLKGTYPRPAAYGLQSSHPNYAVSVPETLAPGCAAGVECTSIGARDVTGSGPERVLIGLLPARTLEDNVELSRFRFHNGIDGYGNFLTYAVTEEMTRNIYNVDNAVNTQVGAIAIRDEHNRSLVDPEDSAHYVFLSHGENGRGAYTAEGERVGDCSVIDVVTGTPLPPVPGSSITNMGIDLEIENCDYNDAIFVSALRSYVNGRNYFDDTVYFNTNMLTSLWNMPNTGNAADSKMYNTNIGNVGVGINTPNEKFHVAGSIRASGSMETPVGFCDPAEDNCVLAERLAGSDGMTDCSAGHMAVGVAENDLICQSVFPAGVTISIAPCLPGEAMTGFTVDANGNVVDRRCAAR